MSTTFAESPVVMPAKPGTERKYTTGTDDSFELVIVFAAVSAWPPREWQQSADVAVVRIPGGDDRDESLRPAHLLDLVMREMRGLFTSWRYNKITLVASPATEALALRVTQVAATLAPHRVHVGDCISLMPDNEDEWPEDLVA
jgi:hypothetical protein